MDNLISFNFNRINNLRLLIVAVECTNYSSLTSGDRKTSYISKSYLCDNKLNGWYRFQEAAGTRMPTSCPPVNRWTPYSSWWQSHQAGLLSLENKLWQWSTNIEVRVCGSFYVYRFSGTPAGRKRSFQRCLVHSDRLIGGCSIHKNAQKDER